MSWLSNLLYKLISAFQRPVPAPPAPPSPLPVPPRPPTPAETALLDAHNAARQAAGLRPYSQHPLLSRSALRHAQAMAKAGTLAHQLPGEPNFATRILEAGYSFYAAGENIAAGTHLQPSQCVQLFLGDPPHRANLLN